jgi:hypothetical protein
MGTATIFPEIKQPEREDDHWFLSSVKAQIDGTIPPLPPTSSWRGA